MNPPEKIKEVVKYLRENHEFENEIMVDEQGLRSFVYGYTSGWIGIRSSDANKGADTAFKLFEVGTRTVEDSSGRKVQQIITYGYETNIDPSGWTENDDPVDIDDPLKESLAEKSDEGYSSTKMTMDERHSKGIGPGVYPVIESASMVNSGEDIDDPPLETLLSVMFKDYGNDVNWPDV